MSFLRTTWRILMTYLRVLPSLFIFPLVALTAKIAPSLLESKDEPDFSKEEDGGSEKLKNRKKPRSIKVIVIEINFYSMSFN